MKVEMVSVEDDFKQVVDATVEWDGKQVTIDSKVKGLENMLKEGYRLRGKHYTEKDGEEFVKNLPFAYHGSRLRAVIVEK